MRGASVVIHLPQIGHFFPAVEDPADPADVRRRMVCGNLRETIPNYHFPGNYTYIWPHIDFNGKAKNFF